MARISGVNIGETKRAVAGLSLIFGLGETLSKEALVKAKISGNPKFSELTQAQIDALREVVEKQYTLETDLKQIIAGNIRRLKEINSYRGHRHTRGLPVRGQRTRTNARTKRGKRVTVGSGRKKVAEKT